MFPYCPGHKIPDRLAARAGSGFAVLRKGGAMDAATGSSPLRQGIPSTCATLDWGAYEKRRIYWPGAGRAAGRRAAASCGGPGCSLVPAGAAAGGHRPARMDVDPASLGGQQLCDLADRVRLGLLPRLAL